MLPSAIRCPVCGSNSARSLGGRETWDGKLWIGCRECGHAYTVEAWVVQREPGQRRCD